MVDERTYYRCLINSITGMINWERVLEAEHVTIPGWEHLDLFIDGPGSAWNGERWRVNEGTTGTWIAEAPSRDQVISRAKIELDQYDQDAVNVRIEKARAKYGLSPRVAAAEVRA